MTRTGDKLNKVPAPVVILLLALMAIGGAIQAKSASAAGPSDIAMKIAGPIIEYGTSAAMKKLGMDPSDGVLPAIEKVQNGIDALDSKVDGVLSAIKQQNFSTSYRKAKENSATIAAHLSTIKGWSDMRAVPTQDTLQRIYKELLEALENLNTHLNDERVGMIPNLMKTDQYAKVTDLQEYWADIRDIRASYTSIAALGMLALDQASAYQTAQWKQCLNGKAPTAAGAKPAPKMEEVFVGDPNTVCRDRRGKGGPHDPGAKARNNGYFKIGKTVSQRSACEAQCGAGCKGIEYLRGKRCELWKVPVTFRGGKGYECRQKVTRTAEAAAPALSIGTKACDKEYPRIPAVWARALQKEAKSLHRGMYAHGVPLMENRKATGFVHLRNAPWALGAPTSFSGYFATHAGARLTGKLNAIAASYAPAKNNKLSLEKFFEKSLIPTRYINGWKCEPIRNFYTQGDRTYQYGLYATIVSVSGKRIIPKRVLLSANKMSGQNCNRLLNTSKTAANKNYRVSNGKLVGGVKITSHWDGFSDPQVSDGSAFKKVTVNRPYFGRFFTFNLKVDDCKRVCRATGSRQCKYCGSRLDVGGRAALTSRAAVDDFIRSAAR